MDKPFKTDNFFHLINVIILVVLAVMVFCSIGSLPDKIPTHFNLAGKPDNFGSRDMLYVLLLVPWGISLLGYLFLLTLPFWKKNPQLVASPGLKKISKVALEKQIPYWQAVKEFTAGLLASLNILFYIIIKQTMLIARRQMEQLNTIHIWLAILVMLGLIIFYMVKMNRITRQIVGQEGR